MLILIKKKKRRTNLTFDEHDNEDPENATQHFTYYFSQKNSSEI